MTANLPFFSGGLAYKNTSRSQAAQSQPWLKLFTSHFFFNTRVDKNNSTILLSFFCWNPKMGSVSTSLLIFLVSVMAFSQWANPVGATYNVSYDHRSLIIDGQRKLLISSSIHYPRSVPAVSPSLSKSLSWTFLLVGYTSNGLEQKTQKLFLSSTNIWASFLPIFLICVCFFGLVWLMCEFGMNRCGLAWSTSQRKEVLMWLSPMFSGMAMSCLLTM